MRGISETKLSVLRRNLSTEVSLYNAGRLALLDELINECKELNPCEENTLSLSVSDARESLNYLPSGTDFHAKLIKFIDASELQEKPKCER